MPKLEAYDKRLDYSYCLGVYPCHQLLDSRPETALRLLLHPDGLKSEGVSKLRERCQQLGVREEMAEKALRRESKKDNCFAALAFKKYSCALDAAERHCVFCQISDVGNLGAVARSAVGFGYMNIALVYPCADAFDPHALRASMGAFFWLNARVYASYADYAREFPDREAYMFALDGAEPLNAAAARCGRAHTLVFGNEAAGLEDDVLKYGARVKIPQSDKIDSLNLAVAASIAMYTFQNIER